MIVSANGIGWFANRNWLLVISIACCKILLLRQLFWCIYKAENSFQVVIFQILKIFDGSGRRIFCWSIGDEQPRSGIDLLSNSHATEDEAYSGKIGWINWYVVSQEIWTGRSNYLHTLLNWASSQRHYIVTQKPSKAREINILFAPFKVDPGYIQIKLAG